MFIYGWGLMLPGWPQAGYVIFITRTACLHLNTKIIGFCENELEVHELSNYPILGGVNDVVEVSRQYKATEIFSTISPDQNESIYQIIRNAEQACIRFKLIPSFNLLTNFPVHIDYFGTIP